MYKNYRQNLFYVLLVFALLVTFTVGVFDYLRLKEEIHNEKEIEVEKAEQDSIDALYTMERIYKLLDPKIAEQMEEVTDYLLDYYEQEPNFHSWDFSALAEKFGIDIYIINQDNVIEFSNLEEEVGLDFKECCQKLSAKLDQRRETGKLYIDEIDVNQKNNQIKKFSYKATRDKKYIIELGYNLEKEMAFQEFNFIKEINKIVSKSSTIEKIHILNFGGKAYGASKKDPIPKNRYENFSKARETKERIEVDTIYDGKELKAKYIPFDSPYDKSATSFKVIEILYNDREKNLYFTTNFHQLIIQLIIISIFSLIVSKIIANWFSKPIYLAYHDSLTNLKNRTAFNQVFYKVDSTDEKVYALCILDLDNFKLVNDRLGHAKGDKLLKDIGEKLNVICEGDAYRLGGDEFAIVYELNEDCILKNEVEYVLKAINETINEEKAVRDLSVSVSIGVAIGKQSEDKEWLFKQADKALYEAKRHGKNQYKIYQFI